jgi:hypothetical protein
MVSGAVPDAVAPMSEPPWTAGCMPVQGKCRTPAANDVNHHRPDGRACPGVGG